MPLYDFSCAQCGPFVAFRTIEERQAPEPCPDCGEDCPRVVSAPNLALMSRAVRQAHQVNERSQHEPRIRVGHTCSSGCGCQRSKTPSATRVTPRRRNQRPWMLGH